MSYLIMPESSLGGLSQAIISFWVKCSAVGDEEPVPSEWMPPLITDQMGSNSIAFDGGSYYSGFTQNGQAIHAAHIWCYPFPGPSGKGPESWKDNLVPFISFGDPDLKFDRVEWKLRTLNQIWVFGKGGAPQNLVAQYPEKVEEPVKGFVPLSCVGAHNGDLRIILQTGSKAQYKGCAWAQSSSQTIHISTPISGQYVLEGKPVSVPDGWKDFSEDARYTAGITPNFFTGYNFRYTDVSGLECAQHPETFIMDTGVRITGGGWHHVLISFDLGGKAAAGGLDSSAPKDAIGPDVSDAHGLIEAESSGPPGKPSHPGPWGQYSGANGEYNLPPAYLLLNSPPDFYSYGAPYEDMGGKYGYATSGFIRSTCRAWVCVDGENVSGAALNHAGAYAQCKHLEGFDEHAIAPPNAFLIPGAEIRDNLTTNKTDWERNYRTYLGKFAGPAAKIDPAADEPRRMDYARPSYSFKAGSIPIKTFAIPGGPAELWGSERNYDVTMAELQIWSGKWLNLDVASNVALFLDGGEPASIAKAEDVLGKPNIRLHWATNWIHGKNTGSSGGRETGSGAGTDPKTVTDPKGQFIPVGGIDRSLPDPSLGDTGSPFRPSLRRNVK